MIDKDQFSGLFKVPNFKAPIPKPNPIKETHPNVPSQPGKQPNIDIQPDYLKLNGHDLVGPDRPNPSVADFERIFGPAKRILKDGSTKRNDSKTLYVWYWAEWCIKVCGETEDHLLWLMIELFGDCAWSGDSAWQARPTFTGDLGVLGVRYLSGESPKAYYARIRAQRPEWIESSSSVFLVLHDHRSPPRWREIQMLATHLWEISYLFLPTIVSTEQQPATQTVSGQSLQQTKSASPDLASLNERNPIGEKSSPVFVDRSGGSIFADETVRIFARWFWGGGWLLAAILIVIPIVIAWAYLSR